MVTPLPPPPPAPPSPFATPQQTRGTVTDKYVLERVLSNTLAFGPDSTVLEALIIAGATTITDLLAMTEDDISDLKYHNPSTPVSDPPTESLTSVERRKLLLLKPFQRYLLVEEYGRDATDTLSKFEWIRTKPDNFERFRAMFSSAPIPVPSQPTSTSSSKSTTLAEKFQTGIKRDVTQYTVFKEERYWDSWIRETMTLAKIHDVHPVFDLAYSPRTKVEKDLFEAQCAFVESVFNRCVHTSTGRNIVTQLQKDGKSGRDIYAALHKQYEKSAEAHTSANLIRQQVNKLQLSSWNGTTSGFLNHWTARLIALDAVTESADQFTPTIRKTMLQQAVSTNPSLKRVETDEHLELARGNPPFTYDTYFAALHAAAFDYDQSVKETKRKDKILQAQIRTSTAGGSGGGSGGNSGGGTTNNNNSNDEHKNLTSAYLPTEQWQKLSGEEKKIIFRKRRDKKRAETQRAVNAALRANAAQQSTPQTPSTSTTMTSPHPLELNATIPEQQDSTAFLQTIMAQSQRPTSSRVPDIAQVLAPQNRNQQAQRTTTSQANSNTVQLNGHTYLQINGTNVHYRVHQQGDDTKQVGSLIDGGASGGMSGDDVAVIDYYDRYADVTGCFENQISDIPLATVAGLVESTTGPVICIFHEYAHLGKGKTIHSIAQLEDFGLEVNERSVKNRQKPGKQRIVTPTGRVFPIQIRNGLPKLDMSKPTEEQFETLPHEIMTRDDIWDPSLLDNELDLADFHDCLQIPEDDGFYDARVDNVGGYAQRYITELMLEHASNNVEQLDREAAADYLTSRSMNQNEVKNKEPDWSALRPCFAFMPTEVLKRTFKVTTQYARNICRLPFRTHLKTRFPAANVPRRSEPVATDTIFSDTPAVCGGQMAAQVFVGRKTFVTDAYGIKTDAEFVGTLEDNIRKRGAMDKLISDSARAEISQKIKDILRMYRIDDYQSEPGHQHQNFAENRIGTLKDYTNRILDRFGAPASAWLLALVYVCYLLNHVASPALGWIPPLQALYGITVDISPLCQFHFWEEVFYAVDNKFPSESPEKLGRMVGISENVGDILTFLILTNDTNKLIYRSAVRSAFTTTDKNLRASSFYKTPTDKKPVKQVVKSRERVPDIKSPTFSCDDLIGHSFLMEPQEDGTRLRARVARKIIEMEDNKEKVKFLLTLDEADRDEIIEYNDLLEIINSQIQAELDNPDVLWTFKNISAHQGPLRSNDPSYNGSMWNVLVNWEDGSSTYEPLNVIAADDPVECAKYAKAAGLLDEPGWKQFRRLVKSEKRFNRMVKQANLKSIRRSRVFKFGIELPRDYEDAKRLDAENHNTKWQNAIKRELGQVVDDYKVFQDLGKGTPVPAGYKKITCHLVFDYKPQDNRFKARYVAGGHLTKPPPLEDVYSGVVSLRTLRLVFLIAELNGLETYSADIGNAYLEADCLERIVIIGGPELADFGLDGHTLIVVKALYGLRTSGKSWHLKFSDTLRDMGFVPCKADPDVWMREKNDIWEYVCVYVDDLAVALRDPKTFMDELQSKYNYKLKGVGPIEYHLGCNFGRDPDGTFYYGPFKYIERMMSTYEKVFGEPVPSGASSPLVKGDHPEIDVSPELDLDGIRTYQSLIGQLQWLVTLGRFDVATAVVTLSRFRAAPREGHLKRVQRIYSYVKQYPHAAIRVRTEIPDYSNLPDLHYDWMESVYGNVEELIPDDMPTLHGNPVVTTTYEDANLYHDLITGRSLTGVLHLVNQTPIEWYTKRQATVETATFGSEFSSAKTATEQIMDLRYTLRMLGVPVSNVSYMFGDNSSVVTQSTIPHSRLGKRNSALAYHRVREAIAAGFLKFYYMKGSTNPSDVLSKHWGHADAWPLLKPLLFWRGDTSTIPRSGE